MVDLFNNLPQFPPALPDDEVRLLALLPDYHPDQCVQAVDEAQKAACRRLEKRGLVKVHRWKNDPIALFATMYAGKLTAATLREAS